MTNEGTNPRRESQAPADCGTGIGFNQELRRELSYGGSCRMLLQDFVHLTWDSDFFGATVGRLTLTSRHTSQMIENDLQSLPADVTYIFDDSQNPEVASALEQVGALLVDVRLCFARSVRPARMPANTHRVLAPGSGQLCKLARASGQFSRFRIDPAFADSADRFFDRWICNSLEGKFDDVVLGAFLTREMISDQTCKGIVTVRDRVKYGQIGILSVDASFRGQGVGKTLMLAAEAWCNDRELAELRVVTQNKNQPAVGLYEACGYQRVSRTPVYHYWRGG